MELDRRALADRIHDAPLQLLGSALLKAEMCEQLLALGRTQELPAHLEELRSVLEAATHDLRSVMVDLRSPTPV